ncbi:hypothetical protein ASPCAL05102 [Aspergillus calidoustus]|uniref:Tachykinin family protein n=1 Tax=Aspergillus calidoustus TaxID=454130 RepID=A0A0U5G356_ASPCI|nr:hypothetical protein ASPCAL05102 [Aspergillus calidoustus]
MSNQRASPPTHADLLFVHYDQDDPQNRSVSRTKASFAQKAHQRKKRLAGMERLKTSSLALRQRLPFAYDAASGFSRRRRGEKSKHDGATPGHAPAVATERLNDIWGPQSQLGQGFIDPFSTTSVPMSNFMNLCWHHYRHFILPLAYPLNSSPMGAWWWQQGLSEPVIHLTLLVSAAGHKVAMDTINNAPSHELQQSIGQFLGVQRDTIKRLNHLLHDPDVVAESTTLTVAALRAIEAISCNFDGVAVHTKGLNALVQIHGGLEHLDHQTLFQIYHSDIMYAALTDTIPARPLIARWRSEILQETMVFHSSSDLVSHLDKETTARLSMLGTSVFEAPWYSGLADTMRTLLRASQRLIQYYEAARLQTSTALLTDNSLFLVLGHQLLSSRYTAAADMVWEPRTVSCLLNEPLRITLFIYLNMRIWNFQEYPIMQRLVNSLRDVLLCPCPPSTRGSADPAHGPASAPTLTLSHINNSAPDVLLWILFIGAMAAQGHNSDTHAWFVHQLADLAAFLELREWEMAREALGGFFYTDQPGQLRGEELWKQVVSTRIYGHRTHEETFVLV